MIIGLLLTISLIIGIGIWSGRKANDTTSFTTGGNRANSWVVCGTIMGTIVSGQSTVGTAQLAFVFGISAWWFTIGAAIGCLILALVYAKPLRHTGCSTLMEVIANEYGHKAEVIGSLLSFIGIYISIIAQIIASSSLLSTLTHLTYIQSAFISIALMMIYVVFGGLWGAGLGGIVKMGLLYIASIVAGIFVWRNANGFYGLISSIEDIYTNVLIGNLEVNKTPQDIHNQYANFFARGPLKDIGSCLSLILGVLATQTYAQGIWSGRNDKVARKGGILCAFLIPPIGAACTLVGMYMRAHYITAEESVLIQTTPEGIGYLVNSVAVFPTFITNHLPPFFGGIVLGTLFITIVGGGSGLALGAATILGRDVIVPIKKKFNYKGEVSLIELRLLIVAILVLGITISLSAQSTFINDLGFLSLGLRGTAVLIPLSCALFFPKRIKPRFAFTSMIGGTAMLLISKILSLPSDPVYWGISVGLIITIIGIKHKKH